MDNIYTACDLVSLRDYSFAIDDKDGQKKASDAKDRIIKWAIASDLKSAERYSLSGINLLHVFGIAAVYLILIFVLWG